jgi:hypothetical protein
MTRAAWDVVPAAPPPLASITVTSCCVGHPSVAVHDGARHCALRPHPCLPAASCVTLKSHRRYSFVRNVQANKVW